MTDEKRKRFEAIVRSLQAKTVANGASEAEALAAAEKARELIDRYQLEIGPEEVVAEGMETYGHTVTDSYERAFYDFSMLAIARYCDVQVYSKSSGVGKSYVLNAVGFKSDIEGFKFLHNHLWRYAQGGLADWSRNYEGLGKHYSAAYQAGDRRKRKLDFIKGCGQSISAKLANLTQARTRAAQPGGSRALVLLDKKTLVQDYMRSTLKLRLRVRSVSVRGGGANEAGRAHGANATIGRPISGSTAARLGGPK